MFCSAHEVHISVYNQPQEKMNLDSSVILRIFKLHTYLIRTLVKMLLISNLKLINTSNPKVFRYMFTNRNKMWRSIQYTNMLFPLFCRWMPVWSHQEKPRNGLRVALIMHSVSSVKNQSRNHCKDWQSRGTLHCYMLFKNELIPFHVVFTLIFQWKTPSCLKIHCIMQGDWMLILIEKLLNKNVEQN